jgi:hypothetical protein
VISKIGIRFTKVDDPCADRSKIDGQTWARMSSWECAGAGGTVIWGVVITRHAAQR